LDLDQFFFFHHFLDWCLSELQSHLVICHSANPSGLRTMSDLFTEVKSLNELHSHLLYKIRNQLLDIRLTRSDLEAIRDFLHQLHTLKMEQFNHNDSS